MRHRMTYVLNQSEAVKRDLYSIVEIAKRIIPTWTKYK